MNRGQRFSTRFTIIRNTTRKVTAKSTGSMGAKKYRYHKNFKKEMFQSILTIPFVLLLLANL